MSRAAVLAGILAFAGSGAEAGPSKARPAPGFAHRGVMEGFYGRPWTWRQRREMVAWMGRRGMNLFVLAPKDEPLQRARWRTPLPDDYLAELAALVRAGAAARVELAWALSPGLDVGDGAPVDVKTAQEKLRAVLKTGVRHLILAFDDTEPRLAHVEFANAVRAGLASDHPEADFTFIPAVYWGGGADSPYLEAVRRRLDSRWKVGWTGPGIVCRAVSAADAEAFKMRIDHSLVLGDNYPVQDRLVDSGRLFLGPLIGRDPALAGFHEAYVANASPLPAASRLALRTAADYARDPQGYDPQRSWKAAIAEAGGPAGAASLGLFARHNASSLLGEDGEPRALAGEIAAAFGGAPGALRRRLSALAALPRAAASWSDAELARESKPWIDTLAAQAQAGLAGLDALTADARREEFARKRREAAALPAVTAGLALERLLNGLGEALAGKKPRDAASIQALLRAHLAGETGAAARLREGLELLAGAAERLPRAAVGVADAAELLPWLAILGRDAQAALDRLSAGGAPPGAGAFSRWRALLDFVPLFACRAVFEEFLSESELAWLPHTVPSRVSWPLRAWLAARPGSAAARLRRDLRAFAKTGDETRLSERLNALEAQALELTLAGAPEELGPWLGKIREYVRQTFAAVDLRRRAAAGAPPGPSEIAAWTLGRERLRSANGLELAFELHLSLKAFAAGDDAAAVAPPWPTDSESAL